MDELALDMEAFGRALRRRREGLGLSKKKLARRAGLSDAYVGNLEGGAGKRPGIEAIARLARALDVSTDDLVSDLGLPGPAVLPEDLASVYRQMDDAERRAWVGVGRLLLDLRQDQAARYRVPLGEGAPLSAGEEPSRVEPIAAYEGTDLERIRRRKQANGESEDG